MRVLVIGSKRWTDAATIERELHALRPSVVIHGCHSGAETIAELVAFEFGAAVRAIPCLRHSVLIGDFQPSARDTVLAFGALWFRPQSRGLWGRTGTGDMVARLLEARLPVRWVPAPAAEAVELTAMPTPEEHEQITQMFKRQAGGAA